METGLRSLGRQWEKFFQRASFIRTVMETAAFAILLTLVTAFIYGQMIETLYSMSLLFFINPFCALYYALRLQPPAGGRIWQTLIEILQMIAITLILNSPGAAVFISFSLGELPNLDFVVLFGMGTLGFPYVFFRTLSRLSVWWQRLREHHLIWSLMNSHLVAVALLQGIVVVPLMLLVMTSVGRTEWMDEYLPHTPFADFFYRLNMVLPILGITILAAMVVLIALLPVSAGVSYFFARRIKQRLEALINVAHTAQMGDYSIRVPISGHDEITTLQNDFNRMIASLDTTVTDLRDEREKVAALLQRRHELMANVSHELRTPLATIRAYLESAQRRGEDMQGIALDANDLVIVQREAAALQTLIDDLFALSRAETDSLSLHVESIDAAALIMRVVETVAPLAWRTNRITVSAQIPPWQPLVRADANRLEQALRNLVHNSLRHTLPGGLIVITLIQNGAFADLQVRDTGEGVPADDLPHIWERFYRGAKNGGTGLGLALVKAFIEAMGGHVAVESTPGEGACFTLSLPLSDEAPLPRPVPTHPVSAPMPSQTR
jgi:signal transduction histidine kinase